MRVIIFVELCIIFKETVNFKTLNIMLLKERTISNSLTAAAFFPICLCAVLIQAIDLSNFPPKII
jgi:hypothetical protein